MALNDEQQQKLNNWFSSKKATLVCPFCESRNWTAGEIVTAPGAGAGGGISIGGPSIPMVQVACNNCGYIALFAANPIGLLQ